MFSVKSIVNLKLIRTIFYFLKINHNFTKSKYIFFCYNFDLTDQLRLLLSTNKTITYCFLKKVKQSPYLTLLTCYLTNAIVCFTCEDDVSMKQLLPLIEKHTILIKIENTIYSMKNLSTYLNSKLELVSYCESYFLNFFTLFSTYSKTLENK